MKNTSFDRVLATVLDEAPEIAALLGIDRLAGIPIGTGGLSDITPAGNANRRASMQRALEILESADLADARAEDPVSADALRYFLRDSFGYGLLMGVDGATFEDLAYAPVAAVTLLDMVAGGVAVRSAADAQAGLERIAGLAPMLLAAAEETLRREAEVGAAMPGMLCRALAAQLEAIAAAPPAEAPLLVPYVEALDTCDVLSNTDKRRFRTNAEVMFVDDMQPALRRLVAVLAEQAERAGDGIGLNRLTRGAAFHAWLCRAYTTRDLTPSDVQAIGNREVVRLQSEMTALLDEVGVAGDTFVERLATFNAEHMPHFADGDEGRDSVRAEIRQVMAETEAAFRPLFRHWPTTPVIYDEVPQHAEGTQPSSYLPGDPARGRPARIKVNLAHSQAGTHFDLRRLVVHEVWPGHHVQLSLAFENPSLPACRRLIPPHAYMEGWAKYAEALGERAGIWTDPAWRLSRLRAELVSTVNLLLDVGIHQEDWSFEEAIAYQMNATGGGRDSAEVLVQRIAMMPGLTLAYKIGMMTMIDLADRTRARLGAGFDLARFHDAVLGAGAVPLTVLETAVSGAMEAA